MLTKRQALTVVEVHENGVVFVQTDTIVEDSGVEIARTSHRKPLIPGADVSGEHPRTQAIAQAAWTPDVVSAYVASLAAHQAA
jgi:hypothetical protein